jgi:hypothetical protein
MSRGGEHAEDVQRDIHLIWSRTLHTCPRICSHA